MYTVKSKYVKMGVRSILTEKRKVRSANMSLLEEKSSVIVVFTNDKQLHVQGVKLPQYYLSKSNIPYI